MQEKQMALEWTLSWSLQNVSGREIALIFAVEEAGVLEANRLWTSCGILILFVTT